MAGGTARSHLLMSRCSVRIMIMATMPDRKSTIMSELIMLNQWIWSSVISRYVSQRDAHRMSLCCSTQVRQVCLLCAIVARYGHHAIKYDDVYKIECKAA